MRFIDDSSDEAVLTELGNRIVQDRLNRNLTQDMLAVETGVSKRTVIRIEQGQSTQSSNLIRVLRALHLLQNFEALIPPPVASPIQQAKMHGKMRKRASSKTDAEKSREPWSWGDEQ